MRTCMWIGLVGVLVLLAIPVSANYNVDGFELKNIRHETLAGGIYVSGGHGLAYPPYTQTFNDVPSNIRYARLYVGVWGGKPEYTGTLQTTFNGQDLGTLNLGGQADTNLNVYVSAFGVYWAAYDVTGMVNTGSNTATATTSGDIDGRVYGMVLVAVYEDQSQPLVEYWINEGNEHLHSGKDTADSYFNGTVNLTGVENATLWTSYLAGGSGDGDTLTLNGNLIATDAAAADQGGYFDLDSWDVTGKLTSSSNTLVFDRGSDSHLHPVLAVLAITKKEKNGYFADRPLAIYRHDSVKGSLNYTVGGSYSGEMSNGDTYTVTSHVDVPSGSTVKLARLYLYWSWSHQGSQGVTQPQMEVKFDGNALTPDRTYYDRKGFGSYDYPSGTYAYDVTSLVTATKDYTTVVENTGQGNFAMYGVGLLVVFEDPNGEWKEYWIAEGADTVYAKTSYGTAPDQTTYINFDGYVIPGNLVSATLITVVPSANKGDQDKNEILFNNQAWTGVLDSSATAVDTRDVLAYVQSAGNKLGVLDMGDYMVPSNAFLILGSSPGSPAPVPELPSAILMLVGLSAFLIIQKKRKITRREKQ